MAQGFVFPCLFCEFDRQYSGVGVLISRLCVINRMTGGGFGGCTVTLVKADRAEALLKELRSAYVRQFAKQPSFIITHAADGAHAVPI